MTKLRFLTAGESHGPCLTAIVDGLPAGIVIDPAEIDRELSRRQGGYGRGKRMQIERDRVEILAGVINGKTIGAPVALRIENRDWNNWREHWAAGDLSELTVPRPGHADYAGMIKYGFTDARLILERASARETAARVAVGALAKQLLAQFRVRIGSHVQQIGFVRAQIPDLTPENLWMLAESSDVRCPDPAAAALMRSEIDTARASGETLGGVFVIIATGVPVGLGSHVQWDRRLDGKLSQALISIPAVKGIEIGDAFENTSKSGREVHDELFPDRETVRRVTNRAGGIEGGMTNGAPIVVRAAVKPIPTTLSPLRSVDLATREAALTEYQRSDVCIVPAAAVVGEAMIAWALADALLEKYGGDSLAEMMR
ncbi:MAG: chorismate synthase [Candidatus Bipolaricaulota bacterium]|nr:chorismate synthase [Candidatus Bipolaricaulota bacterium]